MMSSASSSHLAVHSHASRISCLSDSAGTTRRSHRGPRDLSHKIRGPGTALKCFWFSMQLFDILLQVTGPCGFTYRFALSLLNAPFCDVMGGTTETEWRISLSVSATELTDCAATTGCASRKTHSVSAPSVARPFASSLHVDSTSRHVFGIKSVAVLSVL
jgi:hypothetical protein